jgi:hypothetical protein
VVDAVAAKGQSHDAFGHLSILYLMRKETNAPHMTSRTIASNSVNWPLTAAAATKKPTRADPETTAPRPAHGSLNCRVKLRQAP